MDDDDFSEDERKAFRWLLDENQIQRTHRTLPSGKVEVMEADLSGGQDALVRVLRGERPTHPLIRQALACALEPIGSSLLQLKKRLRRRPGRPGKTEKNAVQDAFDVHASEPLLVREKQKIQVKRPQPAVGTKRKLLLQRRTPSKAVASGAQSIMTFEAAAGNCTLSIRNQTIINSCNFPDRRFVSNVGHVT